MEKHKIKKLVLKNKFNIREIVYHKISEEKGLITAVRIVVDSTHKAIYEYYVSLGMGAAIWAEELELSKDLIID